MDRNTVEWLAQKVCDAVEAQVDIHYGTHDAPDQMKKAVFETLYKELKEI